MASQTDILARVRKLSEGIESSSPDTAQQPTLNDQLELLVSLASSQYGEIVRLGRAFQTHTTAAVAALVAPPAATANLQLYNNEPDGGRSYIIDYAWMANIVSTAVAASAQLWALVGQVRETPPTDAALLITQLNGLGNKDTRARTVLTATALPGTTGVAGNWFQIGPTQAKAGAAATPGYGGGVELNGRIIVPPGRFFALAVMANVVGETFTTGVTWHERVLRLG